MAERHERKTAIAIKYDPKGDKAPMVVAKGEGVIADRILETAQKHKVPVHADPELAALLSAIQVHREIPPHLYQVVAEVLAFIYRMNNRRVGP